jgi:hypothetical protein
MTNTIYAKPVSIFDDWGAACVNAVAVEEKPKEYLDYNTPPLALVIAMQKESKEGYEIHSTIIGVGQRPQIKFEDAISIKDQATAAEIYEYFAKKHTMRRLKGEHISKFMLAVDDLCESRTRIDKESVAILVSLPKLYAQNKKIESIIKQFESVAVIPNVSSTAFNAEIEFVDTVRMRYKQSDTTHYFFKTQKNKLVRIIVKSNDYAKPAWDFVAKQGKVRIKTQCVFAQPVTGYDFNVFQTSTDLKIIAI